MEIKALCEIDGKRKTFWNCCDALGDKPLTAQGFDTVQIDAKIGPLTINAVREFQLSQGLVPDGYASPRLLETLRAAAAE